MTPRQVDDILGKLLKAMPSGNQQVKTAYEDLVRIYNAWKAERTVDNWRDVEFQAQGAMMWIPREENSN